MRLAWQRPETDCLPSQCQMVTFCTDLCNIDSVRSTVCSTGCAVCCKCSHCFPCGKTAYRRVVVQAVPVGLSGLKHLKTARRRWKVRASLLNMLANMSDSKSMSTSLQVHSIALHSKATEQGRLQQRQHSTAQAGNAQSSKAQIATAKGLCGAS